MVPTVQAVGCAQTTDQQDIALSVTLVFLGKAIKVEAYWFNDSPKAHTAFSAPCFIRGKLFNQAMTHCLHPSGNPYLGVRVLISLLCASLLFLLLETD